MINTILIIVGCLTLLLIGYLIGRADGDNSIMESIIKETKQ